MVSPEEPGRYQEQLGLPLLHRGKVRELYALPGKRLLLVATDALSAFDYVLPTEIPDKGAILTQLSSWWFDQLADLAPNHVISTEVPDAVAGRAVVCERLEMVPFECVARGYLTGSGWLEYQQVGSVCGVALPSGLQDGSRLPEPIFTPTTKAAVGDHDEHIDYATLVAAAGAPTASRLRELTLTVYGRAEATARERGVLLADTKLELGRRGDGTLVLADEVLTPDSSRFWDADGWTPGGSLASFDKQYVRDWLRHESGWDPDSNEPPPALPDAVVAATRDRYLEAFRRLTGRAFETR